MSWIKHIPFNEAEGKLKQVYKRIAGKNNYLDNILTIHGLRPHSLEGHMGLYKNVLHHNQNTVNKWFLEAIGVYVSILNNCEYCYLHHAEGMKKLLKDEDLAETYKKALLNNKLDAFTTKEQAALNYANVLTLKPQEIKEDMVKQLKEEKYSEGEILEINQVIAYFNYANRTVLGLGVTTKGDVLGLSPNNANKPNAWTHKNYYVD